MKMQRKNITKLKTSPEKTDRTSSFNKREREIMLNPQKVTKALIVITAGLSTQKMIVGTFIQTRLRSHSSQKSAQNRDVNCGKGILKMNLRIAPKIQIQTSQIETSL